MQIESSVSGNPYQGRIHELDKKIVEPVQQEQEQSRRSGPPTVSSTVLSSSLANVLWAVGGARAPVDKDASKPISAEEKVAAKMEWVQGAYQEYEEF
ncbi:hypothetical protein D3C80_1626630 [compost metagenome]